MTHGGWFSHGFGTIPESFKPALLWTYQNCAAKDDQNQFDTRGYPHRAIMALVNWPIGTKAENPARVMPKAICDTLHGYYVIRNRWQDSNDVVITLFGKTGSYRQKKAWPKRPTKVFGVGQQIELSGINGQHDYMETGPDGSTALRWPGSQPVRYFSVTGTSTAPTTASRMRATVSTSRSSAEPQATLQTFFAGQPMLMSMICAPRSTL